MIKVFCDLCKGEIPMGGGLSSALSRRVELPQRLSLNFTLEFPVDGKPQHVCSGCASEFLATAVRLMREPERVDG